MTSAFVLFLNLVDPTANYGLRSLVSIVVVGASLVFGALCLALGAAAIFGDSSASAGDLAQMGVASLAFGFAWLVLALARIAWVVTGLTGLRIWQIQLAVALGVVALLVVPAGRAWLNYRAAMSHGVTAFVPAGAFGPLDGFANDSGTASATPDQLRAARDVLTEYFGKTPVRTPGVISGRAIPPEASQTGFARALAAGGFITIDAKGIAAVTAAGAASGGEYAGTLGFDAGTFRVDGVDAIERIPPRGGIAFLRVRYRRTLVPSALGSALLRGGWQNPAAPIGGRDPRAWTAPAGFNAKALHPVAAVALIGRFLQGWAGSTVDEDPATISANDATAAAIAADHAALAPYVTQGTVYAAHVSKLMGLPAPAAAGPAAASGKDAQLRAAGNLVRNAFEDVTMDSSLEIGRPVESDRAYADVLAARGIIALDDDRRVVLTERGAALVSWPVRRYGFEAGKMPRPLPRLTVGSYALAGVDEVVRLPTTHQVTDCLGVRYRRRLVLNDLGIALRDARALDEPLAAAAAAASGVPMTASLVSSAGGDFYVRSLDANPARPDDVC